uniref:Uncharacterized protein n=1 Tax=viral metagenome TaxID=1070528 RepID=A0A6M3L5E6_9ZZZZ
MALSETYAGNIVVVASPFEFSAKASGALNEGRVVQLNTAVTNLVEGVPCVQQADANSATPIGYVDSDWEANDMCVVYKGGIARLEDSGTGITISERVMCDSDGKIKTYASGTSGAIVGVALETISASAFGQVFVNISYNTDVA